MSKIIIKIDNYLFDVTEYANNHPGGYNILKKLNNKDTTKEFNAIKGHCDTYVYGLLDKFCIGKDVKE
jgi:cytochrome b involved in lipid metabolism